MKRIAPMIAAMLVVPLSTVVGKNDKAQASAVVLRCTLNGSTYTLTAASGVTGTPSVTVGTEGCAQALSDHLNAGFAIDSTQIEPGSGSLIYTLVNNSNSD
jgi:hypothetical protein